MEVILGNHYFYIKLFIYINVVFYLIQLDVTLFSNNVQTVLFVIHLIYWQLDGASILFYGSEIYRLTSLLSCQTDNNIVA